MDTAMNDQNTRLHALTVNYDVMADTLGYEIITKMRSVQGILTTLRDLATVIRTEI